MAEMLRSGSLPRQTVVNLASALCTALNMELLQETYDMSSSCNDLDSMELLAPSPWLSERNAVIVNFLRSVTAKKGKIDWETSDMWLVHAYENLLGSRMRALRASGA